MVTGSNSDSQRKAILLSSCEIMTCKLFKGLKKPGEKSFDELKQLSDNTHMTSALRRVGVGC